tara:strand:+ start:196 stop:483 length:288 start_codon:yes stop_codon:yes gene_type:complete
MFIGVYPLDLSQQGSQDVLRWLGVENFPLIGRAYHVRRFSIHIDTFGSDVFVGEPDLGDKVSRIAFSEEELDVQLRELGVGLEALDLPFRSDYPI